MTKMSVFDFGDAKAFFASIDRTYDRYRNGTVKSTEDILYVIMGLNHLREWIAPGFKTKPDGTWPKSDSPEKKFSKQVYNDENHRIIRILCNATKHAKAHAKSGTSHDALVDDWPDFDSVADVDLGPPTEHFFNDKPVSNFIDPLIQLYATWFERPVP